MEAAAVVAVLQAVQVTLSHLRTIGINHLLIISKTVTTIKIATINKTATTNTINKDQRHPTIRIRAVLKKLHKLKRNFKNSKVK